jgi:hypothetical protein
MHKFIDEDCQLRLYFSNKITLLMVNELRCEKDVTAEFPKHLM